MLSGARRKSAQRYEAARWENRRFRPVKRVPRKFLAWHRLRFKAFRSRKKTITGDRVVTPINEARLVPTGRTARRRSAGGTKSGGETGRRRRRRRRRM